MAGSLGNLYGSQANLRLAQGQSKDNMLGSLGGAALGAGGFALGNYLAPGVGGTAGAAAGKGLGDSLFGGNNSGSSGYQWEPYKAPSNWMGGY
jgi:hypothetical protein